DQSGAVRGITTNNPDDGKSTSLTKYVELTFFTDQVIWDILCLYFSLMVKDQSIIGHEVVNQDVDNYDKKEKVSNDKRINDMMPNFGYGVNQ
ncbi:21246_t:CDS:2, partial [Entrophospora sp. SA101]